MFRALATLLVAFSTAASLAQTAGMMSFQAVLKDGGGTAVVGAVTLEVEIYDAPTGGSKLDANGDGVVNSGDTFIVPTTAVEGVISIKYGPIAPSIFAATSRWLNVTVTSPVLPPLTRVEIVTPPAIAEQLNARGTGNAAVSVDPTGRVGIGTTTPTAGLQIAAISDSTYHALRLGTGSGGGMLFGVPVVGGAIGLRSNYTTAPIDLSKPSWQIAISGASDSCEFYRAPAGSAALTAVFSINGAGDAALGINPATTAAGRLDVGSVAGEQLFLRNNNFAYRYLFAGAHPSGFAQIGAWDSNSNMPISLALQPGGGNVGIGTATPSHPLVVNGNIATRGPNQLFLARSATDADTAPTSLGFTGSVGGVLTLSNNGANDIRAGYAPGGFLRFIVNNTADPTTIVTPPVNGREAMRLTASGEVGIGTTAPNALLHVRRTSGLPALRIDSPDAQSYIAVDAAGFTRGYVGAGGVFSDQLDGLGVRGESVLQLGAGTGSDMTIAASGNVGIGVTAPETILHTRRGGGTDNEMRCEIDSGGTGDVYASYVVRAIRMWSVGVDNSDQQSFKISVGGSATPSNGTEVVTIRPNGRVGIGTSNPSQLLDVNGCILSTNITSCSDARWKDNVRPLTGGLVRLAQMRPVAFDWRCDAFPDRQFDGGPQIGFIAQEVEKIVPEVVHRGSDGYYSLDYGRLTPLLTAAIQELHAQVQERGARLTDQQRRIDAQEARLAAQDAILRELAARLAELEAASAAEGTR